jgi:hypothetical protein
MGTLPRPPHPCPKVSPKGGHSVSNPPQEGPAAGALAVPALFSAVQGMAGRLKACLACVLTASVASGLAPICHPRRRGVAGAAAPVCHPAHL